MVEKLRLKREVSLAFIVGVSFTAITQIIAVAVLITKVDARLTHAEKQLVKEEKIVSSALSQLHEVDKKVSNIETKLEIVIRQTK